WACIGWIGALWAASIALTGVEVHRAYFARVTAIGRRTVVAYNNHNLMAVLSRRVVDPAAWADWRMFEPRPMLVVLSAALVVAALAATFVALQRLPREHDESWRPAAESVMLLVMLLGPGVAWTHYFIFLLPAMAAAIGRRP